MKDIRVPEGMIYDVAEAQMQGKDLRTLLEVALRWLSEHPIVPTPEQLHQMHAECGIRGRFSDKLDCVSMSEVDAIAEWQRRMFLSPDRDILAAVSDLLLSPWGFSKTFDSNVIEAYRRGKQSREKKP